MVDLPSNDEIRLANDDVSSLTISSRLQLGFLRMYSAAFPCSKYGVTMNGLVSRMFAPRNSEEFVSSANSEGVSTLTENVGMP